MGDTITAFKNIITEAFEERQKSTIKHFVSLHPECKGQVWAIIKRINGWGLQEDMCDCAREYADNERRFLGVGASITGGWLERNPLKVLQAYVRWLNFREVTGGKLFSIGPTFDVRAHHVHFDTDALYGLFKAEKVVKGNLDDFRALASENIQSILRTSGLLGSSWTFNNSITTDGVVMSVHFKRQKSVSETEAAEDARKLRKAAKEAAAAKKEWRRNNPEAAKREMQQKRADTRKAKKERAKEPEHPPLEGHIAPSLHHGTLAEDPGNSPNVTYSVHSVKGKLIRKRFTVVRWYAESGVRRHQDNARRWMGLIQVEQDEVDAVSVKTASRSQLLEHARRFSGVSATIC